MYKKFLVFIFLFIAGLILVNPAKALTITPAKGLVTINRGSEQLIRITVFNETQNKVMATPVIFGVRQTASGTPIFEKNIEPAEKWVTVDSGNVVLSSGEKKEIMFSIKAPLDAYPGSHYLGLGVGTSASNGSVQLTGQLLSIITVQVNGLANESLKIVNFAPSSRIITHKNVEVGLTIKNKGNVEVTPAGQLIINSWGGKEILNEDFYLGNQLLSDSERSVRHDFNLDNKIFWPGIYQTKVVLNYGLTSRQAESLSSFFYLPLWSLITLLILAAGLIAVIIFVFKKIKK